MGTWAGEEGGRFLFAARSGMQDWCLASGVQVVAVSWWAHLCSKRGLELILAAWCLGVNLFSSAAV